MNSKHFFDEEYGSTQKNIRGRVLINPDTYQVTHKLFVEYENGFESEIEIKRSADLRNHSPTGFNWGYGGIGPAQAALAILLEVCNDDVIAMAHYQDFKWEYIAKAPHKGFKLCVSCIKQWLSEKEEV